MARHAPDSGELRRHDIDGEVSGTACGTRLDRDRPTRQTVWPGEDDAEPIEDTPITDRDEDFVAFVIADVERRRQTEEDFYASLDPDTGEIT